MMPVSFASGVLRLSLCILAWLCCARSQCRAHGAYHDELIRLDEQLKASPEDGSAWFQRGWINFLHGDWQPCLMDLEKAERLAPGRFPFDYVRGQALALGGQFEAARTVLDDFIKAHPEHGPSTVARARVLEKMGRHEAALEDFLASLDKKPEPEPDLYQEAAEAFKARNRLKEAAQILRRGIGRLGNIPSLVIKALDLEVSTGQFDAALLRVDAMQKAAPRPEPWMAKRAVLLAQAGRPEESAAAWTAVRDHIAALPNLERGSVAMSEITKEAEAALAKLRPPPHAPAVQVTKMDPKALFPSRSVLGSGSNYEEELDRMDVLVLKEPANALYRFQRGELNLLDGKWKWASEDCEEAERLAPGRFPVDRLRAQILAGEGKLAEARALLDKYLGAHSDDGVAYAARARIAMKAGQKEAALADYRLAIKHTPTPDCNLFLETSSALIDSGHRDEAARLLATALETHKDEPSIATHALDLELAMGAFDTALARVEGLQKTSPLPETWMARRAAILSQAGRREESCAAWLALQTHIAGLPNLQRGSDSMRALSQQARQALEVIASASLSTTAAHR